MANNRLPFGLCEKFHIELPENATPKDAWDALKNNGIEYFEEEESDVLDPHTYLDADDLDDRKHYTDKKTVLLPRKEHERLVSSISTVYSPTMEQEKTIIFEHGNFAYHVEVYGFGNYRVIGKRKLK